MRVVDKMRMLSEGIFDAFRDDLKDFDDPEIRDQALLLLQAIYSGEMDDPLRIRDRVIEGMVVKRGERPPPLKERPITREDLAATKRAAQAQRKANGRRAKSRRKRARQNHWVISRANAQTRRTTVSLTGERDATANFQRRKGRPP